jgi:hypothetical protein
MEKLMKLLAKKKEMGQELSPVEKEAKMSVVDSLKKMAQDHMGDAMKKGMKKVSVLSDSEEGLEHGLDKAKDIVKKLPKAEDEESEPEAYAGEESPEEEAMEEDSELDHMSEDDINKKLMKLMALKEKMKHKQG